MRKVYQVVVWACIHGSHQPRQHVRRISEALFISLGGMLTTGRIFAEVYPSGMTGG